MRPGVMLLWDGWMVGVGPRVNMNWVGPYRWDFSSFLLVTFVSSSSTRSSMRLLDLLIDT
jgi:hypothetical protein